MHLPSICTVLEEALAAEAAIIVDAKNYFFQFGVSNALSSFFGINVGSKRGRFLRRRLTRLPMGIAIAPPIAQKTSELILQLAVKRANVSVSSFVWIDNFMFFGKKEAVQKAYKAFIEVTRECGLTCKSPEMPTEDGCLKILGICINFALHTATLSEKIDTKIHGPFTARSFMQIFGTILFANYAIGKQGLAFFPSLMEAARKACKTGQKEGWDVHLEVAEAAMNEAITLATDLNAAVLRPCEPIVRTNEVLWTDASITHGAAVMEHEDKDCFQVWQWRDLFEGPITAKKIFKLEASALYLGFVAFVDEGGPSAHLLLVGDNQGLVRAMVKGHSSSAFVDGVIRGLAWIRTNLLESAWIQTNKMRADPLTRGATQPAPRCQHPTGCKIRWV